MMAHALLPPVPPAVADVFQILMYLWVSCLNVP
jgi:hypothetical protein